MAREVTLVDAGLGNIASVERALVQVGSPVQVTGDPDLVARARMVVLPGQSAFGAATRAIVDGAMGAALRMVIERGDPFLGICLGMQLLFDGSDENGGQEGLHVMKGRCRRFPDGMEVEAEPGAKQTEAEPAPPSADLSLAQTEAVPAPPEITSPAPASGIIPPIAGGLAIDAGANAGFGAPAPEVAEPEPPPPPLRRRLKVPHMGWNSVEPTGEHYYFVHSFFVEAETSEDVMWMSTYGGIRFPAAVRRNNVLGCQFHPEKSQGAGLKFLRAFLLGGWG